MQLNTPILESLTVHSRSGELLDTGAGRRNRLTHQAIGDQDLVEGDYSVTTRTLDVELPFVLLVITLDPRDCRAVLDASVKIVMVRICPPMGLQVDRRWTERTICKTVSHKVDQRVVSGYSYRLAFADRKVTHGELQDTHSVFTSGTRRCPREY